MASAKQTYRALCEKEASIPIFSRAWWLDAAAGRGNWDVVVVERNGEIVAALPYAVKKTLGFTSFIQPPLTQKLGPWIRPAHLCYAQHLTYQTELMQALIAKLPPFSHYLQQWDYAYTNWLPFDWAGFSQTTRYTFVIDDLSDLDSVYARFSHAKRKDIKKAEKSIHITFDLSAEAFYENHAMTLSWQNSRISYSFELFRKLYEAGYDNEAACTISGYDEDGNLHAALFVVWDEHSAYNLVSTIDSRFRGSGASSLLIREIIRHVASRTRKFDFEGSMTEEIAASFKQFNARPMAYSRIWKTPSGLYSMGQSLRLMLARS